MMSAAPQSVMQAASPLHQSALFLYAMRSNDREWMLSQLALSEQSRLRPLLAELESLGIPADMGLLQQYLGQENSAADVLDTPFIDADESNTDHLFSASAERLSMILKGEPDLLIARFLSLHPWSWRDDVLARLGPSRGRNVRTHMEALVTPPDGNQSRLAKMLMALVLVQLQQPATSHLLAAGEPPAYLANRYSLSPWYARILQMVNRRSVKRRTV